MVSLEGIGLLRFWITEVLPYAVKPANAIHDNLELCYTVREWAILFQM